MRRRRRVLIVTHSYYLRDTRPRRHAEALIDAGFEVDVLCCRDEGEPQNERHRGVNIRRLPFRRERGGKVRYLFEYASFILVALLTVAAMHLRRRYKVVWILSIPNTMVFTGLIPRLLGTPVVLDVRDPMPEFFFSKYGMSPGSPLSRALLTEERLSARFASHLVTVHRPLLDALLRTGVPRSRTTVVMNAPDLRLLDVPDRSLRDPDDRTVLYAGTIAARYGVDVALEAVALLHSEIPRIRLRLVGDGDLVPALQARARTLGIADRISFDGPVSLPEIPAIVGQSWVGVQAHRLDPLMRFSTSTKVLEWCALGLPVVVSRTDGVTHFFSDDDVTFVEPGDAQDLAAKLLELHKDPALPAERARNARETALERFDWDNEKATLIALVKRLGGLA
ncbi:MAG TPA: glycosyltransferase family 4 protein [Actinomycetota bacterium]|nr:glycosyltransferase family 4 protein [Actinomycetota bacterium]